MSIEISSLVKTCGLVNMGAYPLNTQKDPSHAVQLYTESETLSNIVGYGFVRV